MLDTIQATSERKGYKDFLSFLNSNLETPTGYFSDFVTDINNAVEVEDVYFFLSELYYDKSNYFGVLAVDTNHRLLIIRDGAIIYGTLDASSLYLMGVTGLLETLSDKVELVDNVGIASDREVEIAGAIEYGDEVIYNHFKTNNLITYSGRVSGEEFKDQNLGSYNVKIDRVSYEEIEMISLRDEHTQFTVQIAEDTFKNFEYSSIGEVMLVQDTDISRESLVLLEREGVISYTL